jgi:hypothetical protein
LRRIDAEPGVALDHEVERIAGLAQRAVLDRQVGVAGGGEGDRVLAKSTDDVLELDASGAKADRAGVGDVVGDGRQTPFECHLRGKRNVDSRLHCATF